MRQEGLLASIVRRDPAAKNRLEVLVCYPGVHAVIAHRVNHLLHNMGLRVLARMGSQIMRVLTGIEIHPGAVIGRRLLIDHGMGVVIGETAIIGDDVTLYQGVTLGGTGKDQGKRHPTIGNDVMIASGAKILGPFKIGDHSKIGAGSVVLKEVPDHCTVVGVPGRIVKQNYKKVDEEKLCDMDQVHLPNPVEAEFDKLRKKLLELEKKVG
ncbi:serine O-acetyltransferase [Acidaminobacter sp. JC074]|uniref:serine O-acetyltransferase n=1 Tax=Acidaminobacter sp. JC074 TaxID=2530199 RepID=UPI001F10D71E|nr:serine O-acetyltransferase [Acidaminobacter sp. JC074]MCH4890460.1 serine O-acetyltransferase [Acidaminobacter sp. JC074]